VYKSAYTFDADDECWYTNNTQTGTVLGWMDNASAPAGAVGGVLHASVPYGTVVDGSNNSTEGFSILLPSTVDLTGKVLRARVYISTATQGTAWGGGMQLNVGTGADASGWCAPWTNITGFGAWYTYTYDLSACATANAVRRLGVQIVMAQGCAPGDVYIDSFEVVDAPTPTPTIGGCVDVLVNDLETLAENGTISGTNAVHTIVDSGTAPVGAITSGTYAMQVSIGTTGWNNDFLNWEAFAPSDLSNVVRVKMDVYVPSGTLGTWSQIWFRVDAEGGPYYVAATAENSGAPALVLGAQTLTWDIDWGLGTLTGAEAIYKLTFIMNSDMVAGGSIFIDNIRFETCP